MRKQNTTLPQTVSIPVSDLLNTVPTVVCFRIVPRYDLHHAAASGNLGLVEFALSHGQPINSVLNGVLPLHAACAGGSEAVVQYLIDEGADVNATQ